MANYITEDDIEQSLLQILEGGEFKYNIIRCNANPQTKEMNKITNGFDIEDRFKDPHDRLKLAFVCAMWLTGFDVPSLSTLYLDKPMKGHTLMQAIARANRVFPGKQSGIIIDYVNVFKYMQQALSDYATGSDGKEFPAKDISYLINLIDQTIAEADSFLLNLGISLDHINTLDTNAKLDALKTALDRIYQIDQQKEKFKVITNLMLNLYDASKPEVFEINWNNPKFAPLKYLNDLMNNNIDDEKLNRAKNRLNTLLDTSVSSQNPESKTDIKVASEPVIHEYKVIDLSNVDVEALRHEIRQAEYKAIEIDNIREHIEKMLHILINRNTTRIKFSERYRSIIDRYNAGGSENEDYYEQLLQLIQDLKTENNRAAAEGLSEEELEMFDLLSKGRHLTKADEQKVKLAAKNLFQKLSANKKNLFVVDWYKDPQAIENVKSTVIASLDADLPDSFDKEAFDAKINLLFNHFVDMAVQHYGWLGFAA